MKTNRFSEKLISKSSLELKEIANSKSTFDSSFILASLWELENRNELSEDLGALKTSLETQLAVKQKAKAYNSYLIPPDLPLTIKLAAFAFMLDIVIELIGIIFLGRSSYLSIAGIEIPGSLITLTVGIFLLFGKHWAKYALFVVWALSTLFFVLFATTKFGPIEILQQLTITAALVLILLKPASFGTITYSFFSKTSPTLFR